MAASPCFDPAAKREAQPVALMMKPKTPEDHQKFLKQRDFVPPCTNSGIFSAEEYAMLERHGHWLTALATGKIKPLTPAQERFLRVDQGKCEPETIFEIVWTRLKERQKWDEAEAEAEHYRVYDAGEAWFSRANWYKMQRR